MNDEEYIAAHRSHSWAWGLSVRSTAGAVVVRWKSWEGFYVWDGVDHAK
jgi:hypothetical protein